MLRQLTTTLPKLSWRRNGSPFASRFAALHDSKQILEAPQAARVSWLKNVVAEQLPFTTEVIGARNGLDNLAIGATYCPIQPPRTDEKCSIGSKRVDDSFLEMILPFSEHEALRDTMVSSNGKTIRYGKLFELLDALAGDVAFRHCGGRGSGLTIVTATVDELKMYASVSLLNDLRLQGYLSHVGRSSMEVTIDMVSIPREGSPVFLGTTHFVMVARKDGKAAPVHSLRFDNPLYKKVFAEGENRSQQRKQRSAVSLDHIPPSADEITLIHTLHQRSKQIELLQQLQGPTMIPFANQTPDEGSKDPAGSPNVPSVWMERTMFQNTSFMHPQNRNIHGKIFGGYIMRAAFELAWITAACLLGEKNTIFLYVHDIQFVLPVNIGSIVEFSSAVVYSEANYIVVQVVATDVSPQTRTRTRTNLFSYVFHTRDSDAGSKDNGDASDDYLYLKESVPNRDAPHILPKTYEEIVMYLEGRRSLHQLLSGVCEVTR